MLPFQLLKSATKTLDKKKVFRRVSLASCTFIVYRTGARAPVILSLLGQDKTYLAINCLATYDGNYNYKVIYNYTEINLLIGVF